MPRLAPLFTAALFVTVLAAPAPAPAQKGGARKAPAHTTPQKKPSHTAPIHTVPIQGGARPGGPRVGGIPPTASAYRVQVRHPGLVTKFHKTKGAANAHALHMRSQGWHSNIVPVKGGFQTRSKMAQWRNRALVHSSATANGIANSARAHGLQARVQHVR